MNRTYAPTHVHRLLTDPVQLDDSIGRNRVYVAINHHDRLPTFVLQFLKPEVQHAKHIDCKHEYERLAGLAAAIEATTVWGTMTSWYAHAIRAWAQKSGHLAELRMYDEMAQVF